MKAWVSSSVGSPRRVETVQLLPTRLRHNDSRGHLLLRPHQYSSHLQTEEALLGLHDARQLNTIMHEEAANSRVRCKHTPSCPNPLLHITLNQIQQLIPPPAGGPLLKIQQPLKRRINPTRLTPQPNRKPKNLDLCILLSSRDRRPNQTSTIPNTPNPLPQQFNQVLLHAKNTHRHSLMFKGILRYRSLGNSGAHSTKRKVNRIP